MALLNGFEPSLFWLRTRPPIPISRTGALFGWRRRTCTHYLSDISRMHFCTCYPPLVAQPGVAPGFQGYEPRVLLLHHRAIVWSALVVTLHRLLVPSQIRYYYAKSSWTRDSVSNRGSLLCRQRLRLASRVEGRCGFEPHSSRITTAGFAG